MEAPDATTELVGPTLEDEDGRDQSRAAATGDDGDIDGVTDGDIYRRECDRVLDEDSDSGELEQEGDVEEVDMDLDGTDQEVITESTSSKETTEKESYKKKMESCVTKDNWHGSKGSSTIKKPPPLPAAPMSEIPPTDDGEGFPQQYFTVKANRARSENQILLGSTGGFERVGGGGARRTAGSTLSLIQENLR
jgi:hypothetical protein